SPRCSTPPAATCCATASPATCPTRCGRSPGCCRRVRRRAGRLVAIAALLAAVPAAGQAMGQDSPRAAGEAWRAELGQAGLRAELSGIVRLSAAIGEGEPVGTLVLRTDVLEREGQPIYRLNDRLAL